jgi:hypothetical protein
MVEWSEDHMAAIGFLNSTLWFSSQNFVKLETGRGPLVKSEDRRLGKVGEWYVESRHLQACSPSRRRLRTDGLTPASKY